MGAVLIHVPEDLGEVGDATGALLLQTGPDGSLDPFDLGGGGGGLAGPGIEVFVKGADELFEVDLSGALKVLQQLNDTVGDLEAHREEFVLEDGGGDLASVHLADEGENLLLQHLLLTVDAGGGDGAGREPVEHLHPAGGEHDLGLSLIESASNAGRVCEEFSLPAAGSPGADVRPLTVSRALRDEAGGLLGGGPLASGPAIIFAGVCLSAGGSSLGTRDAHVSQDSLVAVVGNAEGPEDLSEGSVATLALPQ
mmetsp:Transcript_2948/g.5479  ORF Transcript_2948/g.5479 Transcript_2948/m.5479 type:complete len:253 (-) Transcript_2948:517-1275(-)